MIRTYQLRMCNSNHFAPSKLRFIVYVALFGCFEWPVHAVDANVPIA